MRAFFLFLNGLSILLLALLPYLKPEIDSHISNIFIRETFIFLGQNKLLSAIGFGIYIFCYTLFPKWWFPWQEKTKLIKAILRSINTELFEGDFAAHRVTLYRKTNWIEATLKNILAIIIHPFSESKWRTRLYLRWLCGWSYLVISQRCAMHCEFSTTMFRIDKNKYKNNGVASYIICQEAGTTIHDLPNINDIDFSKIRSLKEVRANRIEDVDRYMNESYLRDFNLLRLMHQKARHFCGTIITKKDGSPWGVLLVDSTSEVNPFTPSVIKRFNSFAKVLCGIINLEA